MLRKTISLFILAGCLFTSQFASAAGPATVIKLEPQPGGYYDQNGAEDHPIPLVTGGMVTISPSNQNDNTVYILFNVNSLPVLRDSLNYSLLISTPSISDKRILAFNTNGSSWAYSADIVLPVANVETFFEESVTATVILERDDGYVQHVGSGTSYVLRGSAN